MPGFRLTLPASELDLSLCVSSGQVFRWRRLADGTWLGVDGEIWFHVRIEPSSHDKHLDYRVASNADRIAFERFFRLESKLSDLESKIVTCAPELGPYVTRLPGLRVLRPSDPLEILFCFLCTPNNNLERITRMVQALGEYGDPIGNVAGQTLNRFPSIERIASIPESELREKKFGYRGSSIPQVARQLLERPADWLESQKRAAYSDAHARLCEIKGIGQKLADCICLFGLHHLEAVPVDTHLWQAARRLYFPEMKGMALTPSRYDIIGNHFRGRFGELAGWAHQYLFYENLMRWRGRGGHDSS